MSSLAGLVEEETSATIEEKIVNALPVLSVWVIVVVVALFVGYWPIFVTTGGTMLTAILVLIIPSMLYFRLGVTSDFQDIPICQSILPNRLYMNLIQILGLVFIVGNIFKLLMYLTGYQHFSSLYQ
jgi:hypothetical protein